MYFHVGGGRETTTGKTFKFSFFSKQVFLKKCEKDDIGTGAGLIAHIYKDGLIKIEDKHRVLPHFDKNKYNLLDVPVTSCDDCVDSNKIKKKNSYKIREEAIVGSGKDDGKKIVGGNGIISSIKKRPMLAPHSKQTSPPSMATPRMILSNTGNEFLFGNDFINSIYK